MGPYFTWLKDCVAVDKYTFRWDFNSYQANWQFFLFYGGGTAFPFSPESATAGGANWKNQVGTGPFMLTDFVDGSSCTFTRNPNYWGMTTINGKQYQEPFIDKLVYLIVPDQSTELAALQTGKIDLYTQVASNQATNLKQRAPDMIQEKWLGDSVYIYKMNRLDTAEPVSNLQVRQALFMATDFQTIANNVFGGGDILGWPVGRGNPSYTPLENQSAQVQALFSFNTAQAKQMLTAAGYPNGFSINITVNASIQQEIDAATIMVADWAQIGVKVNIISLNQVALASEKTANTFTGLLAWPVAVANPLTPMQWYSGTTVGYTYKTGEPLDVEETAALAEMDPLKEQADATQFSKDALVDCGIIPLTNNYLINCYWPWLTNYYGEIDGAYHNQVVMIRELWINQSLKTSLKY
jgi:peptide/nickel transport system substrate-binding protein